MEYVIESNQIKVGDHVLYGHYGEPLICDYVTVKYDHGIPERYVGDYGIEDLVSQFIVFKVY